MWQASLASYILVFKKGASLASFSFIFGPFQTKFTTD